MKSRQKRRKKNKNKIY